MFNTPEEYLFILNPFATYLTNRRCRNVKNLYISLVNLVISYDIQGYVSANKEYLGYKTYICSTTTTILTSNSIIGNPLHVEY